MDAANGAAAERKGKKMNAKQINSMNADQCMEAIRRLDAKADVAGRAPLKSELALIEKLRARIHAVDPDAGDDE